MTPDFSQNHANPAPVVVGSQPPTNLSRKRPFIALNSTTIPKFGIPINPKVHVSQETRYVTAPSVAARGPPQAAVVEPQPPVPAAATSKREAPQVDRDRFALLQNNILQMIS